MKAKHKLLTAAVTAALSVGMVGEAAASIYGRSYLAFSNLTIIIIDADNNPAATVNNFQMSTVNTASLNGAGAVPGEFQCQGTPGAPGPGVNNCGPFGTRVDGLAVNAPGSVPIRANNNFAFFGPGANQYSNADSVIRTSELTGDATTNTQQIAESELQTGTAARANAEIQSITGLTFTFTVAGNSRIIVSFDATASSLVQIDDLTALFASAQSNRNAELRLVNEGNGERVIWRPNGNTATGVDNTITGGAWAEIDPFDLQEDFGVTGVPQSCDGNNTQSDPCVVGEANGNSVSGAYQLAFSGLSNGTWTLTLEALTSTQLSRAPIPTPEPATLALLGIGLAGAGLASRRRKKA